MKTTIKALVATTVALTLFTIYIPEARAYITLNGTVPVGKAGVVILQAIKQGAGGSTLKFKFSAPTAGAYTFNFCIGPATNPCGAPNSYVVVVPGAEERLAVVAGGVFTDNVLTVSQGTSRPLPFSVTIE